MKKISLTMLYSALAVIITSLFFEIGQVTAASANDTAAVNLTVAASISISSPSDVSLGTITGTGASSTGVATWTVTTNNSGGYKLEWTASSATLTSGSDTIAAYTPAVADTPDTWSVAASDSEWGARLKSSSTDTDAEWGVDSSSEKWLNVATSPREIVSRLTETAPGGSSETIEFKAEVGSSKVQATGNYTVNVTATATTL